MKAIEPAGREGDKLANCLTMLATIVRVVDRRKALDAVVPTLAVQKGE